MRCDVNSKTTDPAKVLEASTVQPMRRGRPPKGNSAEGRDKLLEAATLLFSEQGLDSVSTRQLAKSAGVNLSAITYHFGGKEQLYEAAIRKAIDDLAHHREAVIAHLETMLDQANGDHHVLASLIRAFLQGFVKVLVRDYFPVMAIRLIMRELHHPTQAFDQLIELHINPVQDAIAKLSAVARGRNMNDPETRLLGISVTSQMLMLGIMQPVILARMGWASYDGENADILIASVTTSILRLLGLPDVTDPTEES